MKVNNSSNASVYHEEMLDLLSDISIKIQEIREEFLSELNDLEDMISENNLYFIMQGHRRWPT